jgi:hypothetical protein
MYVFILYLNKFLSNQRFVNQEAALLIDNDPSHATEEIINFLNQTHMSVIIIIFIYPAHDTYFPSLWSNAI